MENSATLRKRNEIDLPAFALVDDVLKKHANLRQNSFFN